MWLSIGRAAAASSPAVVPAFVNRRPLGSAPGVRAMTSIGDGAAASWLGSAYSSINSTYGSWIAQTVASHSSTGGTAASLGSAFANLLASSSQSQMSSLNDIYARMAMLRIQEEQQAQLDQAQADLQSAQDSMAPDAPDAVNTDSGTTIDLNSNIMTLRDGTTIDITTGMQVDPVTHLPYAVDYVVHTTTSSS